MSPAVSGVFAKLLEARRARFNAQFAEARRERPTLDGDRFKAHLAEVVAPLVERVAQVAPGREEAAAEGLYDLSLDLVARDFLGGASRYPALVQGWAGLLPALAGRLAVAPREFAGAITNALYNLSLTPGARPGQWMGDVLRLSPLCGDNPALLEAAKVAAWRAGLPHYRRSALAVCRQLPPDVAAIALGLPADGPSLDVAERDALLDRLLADPWLDPAVGAAAAAPERRLQLVGRVGAFRGFGGHFMAPPEVICVDGSFYAGDDAGLWLLMADRFGAVFHRAVSPPPQADGAVTSPFRIGSGGQVSVGQYEATFPDLAPPKSRAANHHTLAVTSALSHAVFLIALVAVLPGQAAASGL